MPDITRCCTPQHLLAVCGMHAPFSPWHALPQAFPDALTRAMRRGYYAAISYTDHNIGMVAMSLRSHRHRSSTRRTPCTLRCSRLWPRPAWRPTRSVGAALAWPCTYTHTAGDRDHGRPRIQPRRTQPLVKRAACFAVHPCPRLGFASSCIPQVQNDGIRKRHPRSPGQLALPRRDTRIAAHL